MGGARRHWEMGFEFLLVPFSAAVELTTSAPPLSLFPFPSHKTERRAAAEPKREARRSAREAERHASTRCFACRGLGHAARDCPAALNAESTVLGADEVRGGAAGETPLSSSLPRGKETVGLCFRCGSTEHILAKCRRAPPKVGSELPFATCFICAAKVSGS